LILTVTKPGAGIRNCTGTTLNRILASHHCKAVIRITNTPRPISSIIPAPEMGFVQPNIPALVADAESLLVQSME
jgi:hypothetical protein